MKNFKQIGIILILVLLLPVVAACSSPSEPEPAGDAFIPAAQSDTVEREAEPTAPALAEAEVEAEAESAVVETEAEAVPQDSEGYPAPDSRTAESDAYPAPAVAEVEEETAAGAEAGAADSAGSAATFVIDPAASSVSYSVEEEFFNREVQFVTAVGTTSEIEGSLVLELGETPAVAGGEITVDISTLQSDSNRRDNAIRSDWLESSTYPVATFVPKSLTGLSGPYTEGSEVSFQLVGDLTVREMTNEVTFDVTATLANGVLSGTATTLIMMADYGFEPPNIANILIVTDGVTLTINLVANQG